jgi:transposase-like protein
MTCPYCGAATTTEQAQGTALGYRKVRCQACGQLFNERTGTPFNFLGYPTDIVLLVVMWRFRYKFSLRDLAERCLTRGFQFTHEAIRVWEARFAPLIAERLRAKRHGRVGVSWYGDETYVKVQGRWCYLYRAIDCNGNLVDSRLSETRDLEAAKQFFAQALALAGQPQSESPPTDMTPIRGPSARRWGRRSSTAAIAI